jgi:hypothetical protein
MGESFKDTQNSYIIYVKFIKRITNTYLTINKYVYIVIAKFTHMLHFVGNVNN